MDRDATSRRFGNSVYVGLYAGQYNTYYEKDARVVFGDFVLSAYDGSQSVFHNNLALTSGSFSGSSFQFQVQGGPLGGKAVIEASSDFATWQSIDGRSLNGSAFT